MISVNHKITQKVKRTFLDKSLKTTFKHLSDWDISKFNTREQMIANYFKDKDNFTNILLADLQLIQQIIDQKVIDIAYSEIGNEFKVELLNKFNFENFRKSLFAYEIYKEIGIITCPYCNRTYTSLIKRVKKDKNGEKWELFFELDHFYPKSLYPYLSHSLYNLIPVCGTCNRKKSNVDVNLKSHYHPYDESKSLNEHITFKYDNLSFISKNIRELTDIKIKIEETESACPTSIENHKKLFAFDKLYNANSDETDELAQRYYMYYHVNIKNDEKIFKDFDLSNDQILRYISGVYLENDKILDRPLGKLKRDLILDLNTNRHFIK